jgi:muramoyltetrapeptide carboxypeptidase
MNCPKLIHVVASGMPFDPEDLQKSMQLLKTWGFEFSPNKYPSKHLAKGLLNSKHPICASDRKTRWESLKSALTFSEDSIVWAVRGGYGSLHLVPFLQKLKKPQRKKLFIGFSDNTTLHQHLNQKWHWPTWHGPHLDRLHKLSPSLLAKTRRLLEGRVAEQVFKNIKPLNGAAEKVKALNSKIVGGNLITLQSSLATGNQLNLKNRILFIEDIGERGYRIDRVLEHFSQAQIFRGVQAVILGPFVGGAEPDGRDLSKKVFSEFSQRQSFPVFSVVPSGHIANSQILPFETAASLKRLNKSFQLTVSTGLQR